MRIRILIASFCATLALVVFSQIQVSSQKSSPTVPSIAGSPSEFQSSVQDVDLSEVRDLLIAGNAKQIEGRSIFTYAPDEKSFPRIAVVDIDDGSKSLTKENSSIRTYIIKGIGDFDIDDPQLSPDNRRILFKVGNFSSRFDTYHLYLLDLKTQKIQQVSKRNLNYYLTSWSPDGKYVAFITGGDRQGSVGQMYGNPLELYIYDCQKRKEQLVTKNNTIRDSVAWAAPHSLLYGALYPKGQATLLQKNQEELQGGAAKKNLHTEIEFSSDVNLHPNIFEFSIETGKSRLIIKNGYRPHPSPDGRRIAFFGSENPAKPFPLSFSYQTEAQGMALSVAQRNGEGRVALNREKGSYPSLLWSPTSDRLISVKEVTRSPDAQSQIKEWDIKTKKFRVVASLRAKDAVALDRSGVEPQFQPLAISNDGRFIFINVSEAGAVIPQENGSEVIDFLRAINLQTGEISTVYSLKSGPVYEWHDLSTPEIKTSETATVPSTPSAPQ